MNSKSRIPESTLLLMFLVILSSFVATESVKRARCHLSRHELLAMKVEDAFDFLLEFYDDNCPSIFDENLDMGISRPSKHDYGEYCPIGRENYESIIEGQINFTDEVNYYTKSHRSKSKGTELQNLRMDERQGDTQVTQNQYELLSQFYDLLDGENWRDNSGWKNEIEPICEWYGIQCDQDCSSDDYLNNNCPVIGIWISENNAYGDFEAISTILEQFSFLRYLDFSLNFLFGILTDINLPIISYLNLIDNKIVGTIPDFQGMPNINNLEIDGNQLEGTVPDFSGMISIAYLSIGSCDKLIGTLPDFSMLPNIQDIWIYRTNMHGQVPDFRSIPNIQFIVLFSNQLSGTVPDFNNIPVVQYIVLYRNQIGGTIPNFSAIPNIKYIDISTNKLSGSIPDFSRIPYVSEINFSSNDISGEILDFSSISNIQYIVLYNNHIGGAIPNFSAIPNVEYIDISTNNLSGTVPDFNSTPKIQYFGSTSNQLYGKVPDFSSLPNLVELYLSGNQLNGTIPNFSNVPYLLYCYLSSNLISGTLPEFNNIPNVEYLILSSNQLNGTIPDFLHITKVEYVILFSNNLRGNTPDFRNMPNAKYIALYSNQLNGIVPNFSFIPKVEYIDLSSNLLNGTIPDFSSIKGVIRINLSNNNITGEIPDFKNLLALENLDISRNKLKGEIPQFSKLHKMTSFSAYENNIAGRVPSFENCLSLKKIILYRNKLNDNLPSFKLPNLSSLDISENEIIGSINYDWEIPSIQYIDLSRNKMNGSIPYFFEKLFQLKSLTLSHNKFSGYLPTMFWNLANLVTIDLKNNSFSGDVRFFISPDNAARNYNYTYVNLLLDDNELSGELNWWIFYYVTSVKTLGLKNNKINKLGELSNLLNWISLDLSGNPIVGSIPDTFNRFSKLEYLGLKNTTINHEAASFLPYFMNYTDSFNLEDQSKLYMCPSIVSNSGLVEMKVDMNPTYYDYEFCKCLPGYFGFGDKCIQCPRECECLDGISLKNCFASPSVVDLKSIIPCSRPESCSVLIPVKVANSSTTTQVVKLCEEGYEGHGCSKCKEGYGSQGRSCVKCNSATIYSTLILVSIGFCLFITYLYRSETSKSGVVRIVMFHLQTLSIISPGLFQSDGANKFIDVSSSIGSIQYPNLSCVLEANEMLDALLFSFARIPLFILLGSTVYVFGSNHSRNKVIFISLNLLFLIYYSIAREVFGVFGCTVYDDGDGIWYMNYAPWIECSPASEEYKNLLGLSVPVFLLFLVGLPTFVMWKMRDTLSESHYESEERYGFLYLPYKEKYKLWEFFIIARRISFSFIISVIPYTSTSIFFLSLVIVIQVSIWMQRKYMPYVSDIENQMELSSLYIIFVSFFLALLSNLVGSQTWITVLMITLNVMWLAYSVLREFATQFLHQNLKVQSVPMRTFKDLIKKRIPDPYLE